MAGDETSVLALPHQVPVSGFEVSAPTERPRPLDMDKFEPITARDLQGLAKEIARQLVEQSTEFKEQLHSQLSHLEAEMKSLVKASHLGTRSKTFGAAETVSASVPEKEKSRAEKSQAPSQPSEKVLRIKTDTGEVVKVKQSSEHAMLDTSGKAGNTGVVPQMSPSRSVVSGFRLNNSVLVKQKLLHQGPGCYKRCNQMCFRIVQSRYFELTAIFMILLNTFLIGVQTGWQVENVGKPFPVSFWQSKLVFACIFTLELTIRAVSEGSQYLSSSNKHLNWNLFDLSMLLAVWLEEFVHGSMPQVSALRVLRVLRLVTVLRVVRVMRFFRDLRIIVSGMLSSARSLLWCLLLILLLTCIWSLVVLEVLVEELPSKDERARELLVSHFGGTARCMYTMFLAITGGLDWGEAAEPLNQISPVLGVMFMLYVGINIFCVFNVVTCVFVDKANQFTKSDIDHVVMEEMATRETMIEDMKNIFEEADSETNFRLSLNEFEYYIHDARVQSYFRKLGLNVERESAVALFHLIDIDRSGYITLEEFVDGCSQFVGGARQLDIARLQHDCKVISWQVEAAMNLIKGQQTQEEEKPEMMHRLSTMPIGMARRSPRRYSAPPGR